jgi:hypothetical protein
MTRSRYDRLVSILCPLEGKKNEKISKQTKQYEKIKTLVFNYIACNCLISNKLDKPGGTNPCFPATPIIYLLSIIYQFYEITFDRISE